MIKATTGRPPGRTSIKAAASRAAGTAIEALASVAADLKAPATDRVSAAVALLNHASGQSRPEPQ